MSFITFSPSRFNSTTALGKDIIQNSQCVASAIFGENIANSGPVTVRWSVAIGNQMISSASFDDCVLIGYQTALSIQNQLNSSVAIGSRALRQVTGPVRFGHVAVGHEALRDAGSTDGQTAVGYQSLFASGGNRNTAIGYLSGSAITTGAKNTIVGSYTGNSGGLDITASSNNVVLSDGDGNIRARSDSSGNWLTPLTATPPTIPINSEMVFNLTSNTNLRISVRGTDGVTRTANITLA